MDIQSTSGRQIQKETKIVIDFGNLQDEVVSLLEKALNLAGRTTGFTAETPLLGHLPEMDSLGAVGVIAGLEEKFHITIEDDEIDGTIFQTVGSLVKFVASKMNP